MDVCTITLVAVVFCCLVSTITDIILFRKFSRTKDIVSENNREIYDHDKTLADLKETVEELKNG